MLCATRMTARRSRGSTLNLTIASSSTCLHGIGGYLILPVPAFNVDGVIPPYTGATGPGGPHTSMSPYFATCLEVVQSLGTSPQRLTILGGWLAHRAELRAVGMVSGFQWLDGSFLEDKVPNDLDIVTFIELPPAIAQKGTAFFQANQHLIDRNPVKQAFSLDLFWVDLGSRPQSVVTLSRYYFGLFSHRRGDDLWKGMLEVNLADPTEPDAATHVAGSLAAPNVAPVGVP